MNKLIALTSLTGLATLAGCLCGGYSGGGDRVFTRNGDMLIVCENNGFSAQLAAGNSFEGLQSADLENSSTINGALGSTGARLFALETSSDTMTGMGDGTWTEQTLDQTALDHANVLCNDLETRAWWNTPAGTLPSTAVFTRPDANGTATDTITLKTDGTMQSSIAGVVQTGSYDAIAGSIVSTGVLQLSGVYDTDGTLVTTSVAGDTQTETWQLVTATAKVASVQLQ